MPKPTPSKYAMASADMKWEADRGMETVLSPFNLGAWAIYILVAICIGAAIAFAACAV